MTRLVLLGAGVLAVLFLDGNEAAVRHHRQAHHESNSLVPSHETTFESDRKLMIECQNPDYRLYIKCLKREKRQHRDANQSCLDECFQKNCTTPICVQDCHSRCNKRRLIETHSKTWETVYECDNKPCDNASKTAPNITTNIHIENVLPNVTSSGTDGKDGGDGGKGDDGGGGKNGQDSTSNTNVPKIDIHNTINNQQSPFYGPMYPPLLPTITIGFGGGSLGGGTHGSNCMFSPWPCFAQVPTDCSQCNNPFLQYRCDLRCYPNSQNNSTTTTTTTTTTQRSAYPFSNRKYDPRNP